MVSIALRHHQGLMPKEPLHLVQPDSCLSQNTNLGDAAAHLACADHTMVVMLSSLIMIS